MTDVPGTITPVVGSAPPVDLRPRPKRRRLHGWVAWIPIVLGVELALSVFMWPHTRDSQINTWLVGVLLAGFGALSLYKPWVCWINAVLAVWLGVSTLSIDHHLDATVTNNMLAALSVFAGTLAATDRLRRRDRP